ncbi:hypothetical protein [Pseudonocardia parietis]|uniref:Uncharacterized protein n=1 Tax=Pseudonocardia parietis TaxID=570936 RepID=A0ABS4VKS4_9PSEU|nr:hypothetical protein [Pseudonocardia parietis]MBP2364515.1 hypothetical protein [Pseudonocardia parietis]
MRITGPALTLAAVGAIAAGVATANVVLTGDPEPQAVEQATGALALGSPLPAPAAAPAPAAPAEKVVYKGRSTNGAVTVDIWVENGNAKAYVCDGEAIESWTKGAVAQNGPTRLTADDGSWVEYTVQDGAATGTASTGGKSWDFTANRAPADSGASAPAADTSAADTSAADTSAADNPAADTPAAPAAPDAPAAPAAPPADTSSGGSGSYGGSGGYGGGY